MLNQARDVFADETLAVTSGAVVVPTLAKSGKGTYAPATGMLVTVETGDIRFWMSGTAPTTTTGHVCKAGDSVRITGQGNINDFKMIASSTTAAVQISYER